jgi:hypothetical protein
VTRTTVEPRSPHECAATLSFYRRHRAAHPLPDGWYADASGLEDAAEDFEQEMEPIPYLAFDRRRRQGELSVAVSLDHPVTAAVSVTDIGRDLLTPEELAELLYALLGIEIDPADIDDPDLITEGEYWDSEGPVTPTDNEPAAPHSAVVGQTWSLCLPYPYPPGDRPHLAGGPGR